MPIHDWTRVKAGIFHDFHNAWITEIRNALNKGILPKGYYALGEQFAGPTGPDVLTLQLEPSNGEPVQDIVAQGATALAVAPPKVRFTFRLEQESYVRKQRTLVIRHSSDDRIVAFLEIVSPGNKANATNLEAFVHKALAALNQGIHLLVIDLHPPTPRDPRGMPGVIAAAFGEDSYVPPPDKPLSLGAYVAGPERTAYVEPVAVGDVMPGMPLFLDPAAYVNAPLEKTYQAAWDGAPERWRRVLEE